jgi:Ca2+ transporting ATPase
MEGPAFYDACGGLRSYTNEKGKHCEEVGKFSRFNELSKKLVVLARSRPEDKYLMVTGLRQ